MIFLQNAFANEENNDSSNQGLTKGEATSQERVHSMPDFLLALEKMTTLLHQKKKALEQKEQELLQIEQHAVFKEDADLKPISKNDTVKATTNNNAAAAAAAAAKKRHVIASKKFHKKECKSFAPSEI